MVLWLEDQGYPALIVPPTHVDPWLYEGDPNAPMGTIMSLTHAAVEAGLGTLGLAQQLITPQFGPRVMLTAVLSSVPITADQRMTNSLCEGPSCGRCVKACPADAVKHWDRDWVACNRFRSPHGFSAFAEHIDRFIDAPDTSKQKAMLRSKDQFYLWQSILRGAGVITGCRRCQDVCPIGEDYSKLTNALEEIPETTPEKVERLAAMEDAQAKGQVSDAYVQHQRWIGVTKGKY